MALVGGVRQLPRPIVESHFEVLWEGILILPEHFVDVPFLFFSALQQIQYSYLDQQ